MPVVRAARQDRIARPVPDHGLATVGRVPKPVPERRVPVRGHAGPRVAVAVVVRVRPQESAAVDSHDPRRPDVGAVRVARHVRVHDEPGRQGRQVQGAGDGETAAQRRRRRVHRPGAAGPAQSGTGPVGREEAEDETRGRTGRAGDETERARQRPRRARGRSRTRRQRSQEDRGRHRERGTDRPGPERGGQTRDSREKRVLGEATVFQRAARGRRTEETE